MKAAVCREANRFSIEEIAQPSIGPNEVLVKIKACAICNTTDVRLLEAKSHFAHFPAILGHECAGDVVKVGENVSGFSVGDRVSGGWNEGRIGDIWALWGGYAEYGKGDVSEVLKLPESVSYEEGALLLLFSEAINGIRRSGFRSGESVVILGQGPVGLLLLQAVNLTLPSLVITTDIVPERLEESRRVGADYAIDATESPVQRIMELTDGRGADVVIEAVGNASLLKQTPSIVANGGRIVMFGNQTQNIDMDYWQLYDREADLISVNSAGKDPRVVMVNKRAALRSIVRKSVDLKRLITHRFPLEDIEEGFELVRGKKAIKVIVVP